MSIKVELTGQDDREGPWKTLVAGFGGSGKSLLASTAEKPLFVFFKQDPPLKSIASRAVPHVKLVNDVNEEGRLTTAAHDKMLALLMFLQLQDHNYETLVLDTGNELFQAMKESRRLKNNGEFGPGDWDWLAITYRQVIEAVIEMPMDVIVLFHIKNETLDEGVTYRDLLLQGSITPEVPTWFDVVGVMDNFEVVDEEGDTVTRRSFLTAPSRLYPWLKDHSGVMPRRFDISPGFVGDYPKMRALWVEQPGVTTLHETIQEIPSAAEVGKDRDDNIPVPSPEDLQKQKAVPPPKADEPEAEVAVPDVKTQGEATAAEASDPPTDEAPTPSPDSPQEQGEQPVEPEEKEEKEKEVSLEEAEQNVTEALDAQAVLVCTQEGCGVEVDDAMHEISQIRFRTNLCKEHYIERMREAANA